MKYFFLFDINSPININVPIAIIMFSRLLLAIPKRVTMVKYAHNALLCLEFFNFWDWYVYRDGKNKQKGVYIRNISPDVNLFPMSPYSTFPTAKLDKRARSPIHPKTQITVDR